MNIENLLNFTISDHISLTDVLLRLIVAGLSGLLISRIYRLYHGEEASEPDMMHSLIFLSLIICAAMMVIGNNLASAFGLVGAVSIIRFRTSVKSARDMSFVFFAVVMGMSCGLGFIFLAVFGLLFISLVMLVIYFFSKKRGSTILPSGGYKIKINYNGSTSERRTIEEILKMYSASIVFDNLKIEDGKVSLTYDISLDHMEAFDSLHASFNENPQLTKLKIFLEKKD
jgi:uncharacterized membrane protein YhiD involved in acid resistance